jgi:ribonuclease D
MLGSRLGDARYWAVTVFPNTVVRWLGPEKRFKELGYFVEYELIESDDRLQGLLADLQNADVIGFDTEFVAEDCFRPDLCLLQISTRSAVFIVDPKRLSSIESLWQLLADPKHTLVVHAGREEFLFCYRALGRGFGRLFDVQLALGMVGGEYPASYGKLLQRTLGVSVSKGETRTDWRKRPLTNAQLDYAALDVLHLPELYHSLRGELEAQGRLTWLLDELNQKGLDLIDFEDSEGWSRISGVQSLRGRQLSVVRELWLWRNQRAATKNMPARRVLRDDLIIELAKRGSTDQQKIAHIRGLHHPGVERFLPDLAQCIARGMATDPPIVGNSSSKLPRPPVLLQQFLSAATAFLCRNANISPSIVATTEDVGRLASHWLAGSPLELDDPNFPALLKGWRAELVGKPLYDIFLGKRTLWVSDPKDEMPLSLCNVPNHKP